MTDCFLDETSGPKWAVIDIGSNSVRLVMYEGPPRSPIPVFNEKTLCGLGEIDRQTGELRPASMHSALDTLKRFRLILDSAQPSLLHVFATAAVRDAPNGRNFLGDIEEIGFSPVLLPGKEEARLAAMGILSGAPEILDWPHGALAGDIGGGSLELSHIDGNEQNFIGNRVSLPLGALRLSVKFGEDRDAARDYIRKKIDSVGWLNNFNGHEMHIVGGAWRGLARISILKNQYPLEILDRYAIMKSDLLQLCQLVSQQSAASLAAMPVVQRRRAPTLPFAAMVLEAVIETARIDRIEIASSGVREGMLFAGLEKEIQQQDPLIAVCKNLAERYGSHLHPDGDVLFKLINNLFVDNDKKIARWRHAAALLCNFSAGLQPDERAIHSAKAIMALPLQGLDHPGRIYLSAALAVRHGAGTDDLDQWLPHGLLKEHLREEAIILGLALRFLATLSPGGGPVLETAQFKIANRQLVFYLPEELLNIWGNNPARRFTRLAEAMDLEAVSPV